MAGLADFVDKHINKALALLIIVTLYIVGDYNYLLFHSLAEMVSIGTAWAVFMLAWNSRDISENTSLTFLGIAYLFIGILDLFHTLAFKGINIFTESDANLPTQLWISARYLHSVSFLIFAAISRKKINSNLIVLFFVLIVTMIFLSIFTFGIFPACYIEGKGLTAFKIISEYIISFIFVISALIFSKKQVGFDRSITNSLILSIVFLVVAELSFTFYQYTDDILNKMGHLFKILSSFFVYKSLIELGVKQPLNLLFHDIKHSEESLRGMNDELTLLNERLETELQQRSNAEEQMKLALKELERSNKELEQFAYVASHDLQEPLRMVANYTRLLEKRYKENLDESALEYIQFAVDGASRMQMLIKGLLDYSRISMRGKEYQLTDMNKILSDALKNLSLLINESDASISKEDMPSVHCDQLQIMQLFQNLIGNALKFRDKERKPEITITSERSGEMWLFAVKDNGIGISQEFFERIFYIFQRLHSRVEYPGTGIGLAVCKRIVERHGGQIWVESTPGKGTTFYFTLPNA